MSTDSQQANSQQQVNSQQIPIKRKTSRVFMLEETQNVDVTSAYEYGPIIPLFKYTNADCVDNKSDRPSIWKTGEFTREIIKRLEENDFDPENDYLLIAGHVVPTQMMSIAATIHWETIQFLFWSSYLGKYVARRF